MTEQEGMNACFSELAKEQAKQTKLLENIRKQKGDKFYNSLISLMADCEADGVNSMVVAEPIGRFQEEGWGNIKDYWIDQYENGGITGDNYAGYVYVKLKDGKYFRFHYSI